MSPEDQKQARIARLNLYAGLDLSPLQKSILNDLIFDLKSLEHGRFFLSEKIKQDAIAMAKITPRQDFINLFCIEELTELVPKLVKSGQICTDCISSLEAEKSTLTNGAHDLTYRTSDCDCLWTCTLQAQNMLCDHGDAIILPPCPTSTPNSTGCCNATGGCGLFANQTCTGLVACPE